MAGDLQAILFDLDGVLIDSEPAHLAAEVELLGAHGFELTEEIWMELKGVTDRQLFQRLRALGLETAADDLELGAAKLELLCRLLPERARPFPEAAAVVRRLDRWPLGLTTSSCRRMVDLALELVGVDGAFRVIVSGEDVNRGKPDPEPFLLTASRLGVDAARCVAIEDSIHGVESAVAAGMTCIAVEHSFPATDLARAHRTVPTIAEVPAAIAALAGARSSPT